ncbi:MAG: hypothetical protein OEZ38_09680 [Gammaproteobacteria bacterium]|nr:hypothetical protein [Gammaproteobacteria bacterium]
MKYILLFFIKLLIISFSGQLVASNMNDFPVSARSSLQSLPTVAYNPVHDQFLVTWSDVRYNSKTDVDIYGRILDAQGKPVSDDIVISNHKGGQGRSSVAFDPVNKQYLVVWSDWRNANTIDSDIYAQRINFDGKPIGKNFAITNLRTSQKQAAVAFDTDKQRFLVAWKDDRLADYEKLYGRFISPQGELLDKEFLIAKGEGKQDRPSLVYDPKRKRFLVVWRDIVDEQQYLSTTLEGKGIFAAFIDKANNKPEAGILIDTEEDACLPPSLYAASYSAEDDLFLVVWTTARDYQKMGLDVFGALVRASDGKHIGKAFPIAVKNDYQEFPSVVFDQKQKRFLVIWYDLRRDPSALNMDLYGRYISPQGDMSEEFLMTDNGAPGIRRFPAVAYSQKSSTALLLWEDSRKKTRTQNHQRIYARTFQGQKQVK